MYIMRGFNSTKQKYWYRLYIIEEDKSKHSIFVSEPIALALVNCNVKMYENTSSEVKL